MKKSPVTEAHRVATDIAAIKSALQQQGYTTRKRPKQAAWTIIPLNQRGTGRNFQANNPTGSYQIVFDVTAQKYLCKPMQDTPSCGTNDFPSDSHRPL